MLKTCRLAVRALGIAAFLSSSIFTWAQKSFSEDDLKALTSSGRVEKNVYSNAHAGFRLALPEPTCDPKLNTVMDSRQHYAVLLGCTHVVKGWKGMYTFTIAADYRASYPTLQNLEPYVRGMRHSVERDATQRTVQPEQQCRMHGLDFVESILSNQLPEGTYYQGVACTDLKGYILCFEAESSDLDAVRSLLILDHKLEVSSGLK
jgi:hypothetical protein